MPKSTNTIVATFIALILAGAMSPHSTSSARTGTFKIECKFSEGFLRAMAIHIQSAITFRTSDY